MRKKNLLAGIYNVYVVFDKVSKHYKDMYFSSTDEDFVRTRLPTIIINTPLRDLQIFKIGIFNDVTGELKPTVRKKIDTDCYLFAHSSLSPKGENLPIEKIEDEVIKAKNEILATVGSENENNSEVSENE